jgi:hypothetical protein
MLSDSHFYLFFLSNGAVNTYRFSEIAHISHIIESGEMKEHEEVLQEHNDAPGINVSNVLVEALKKLIRFFSLEEVKKALVVAESDL